MLATSEWGVIHTARQSNKLTSIINIGTRYLPSDPGIR